MPIEALRVPRRLLAALLLPLAGAAGLAVAAEGEEPHHQHAAPVGETDGASPIERQAAPVTSSFTRQGVVVEMTATPAPGRSMAADEIRAGDWVNVDFRLTDAATKRPLQGQFPGAWVDYVESWKGEKTTFSSCKERVGLYLQGLIGVRPLIDLNSYFVLVLNRDPSISVIDPITGITGITQLFAQINLKSVAADWAKTSDEKLLFVSMPRLGELAVVDTDSFKVIDNVAAGARPMRLAVQPDSQYVWVGNDSDEDGRSGVTVIEAVSQEVQGFLPTGEGHHEIAFTDDSRFAFVTNRRAGTVSMIDVETLRRLRDFETGPEPISLAFSSLSQTLFVADGQSGEIAVIDPRSQQLLTRVATGTQLGPVRVSQDGRWAVVVGPNDDVAHVIDATTNRITRTIEVDERPYQVAFSRSFAYVRSLGSERVSMIDLSELSQEGTVPVVAFAAGERPPEEAKEVGFADVIVEAPGEAAVLVTSPADTTVYYYMEGMNAPMGNFRNYGHLPRAVQVVDRSMQERQPGVYSTTLRVPESGKYEIAFLLDSPSILHCFELAAAPNAALAREGPALAVDYLNDRWSVGVGETVAVRFRLSDRESEQPRTDLEGVGVVYFVAPGGQRKQVPARHTGGGIYEADLTLAESGAHYVYAVVPSKGIKPNDLHFMTLVAGGRPARR